MVDRWEQRADPKPGQEFLYWHILLKDHPAVQETVATGQGRLASFQGLHFTPRQWLHVTTLVAGPLAGYESADIQHMIERASQLLANIRPVTVTLERVLYHPEAIVLRVDPPNVLNHVRHAVQTASSEASKVIAAPDKTPWVPHVTIAYSTAFQNAQPIMKALGSSVPSCQITIGHIHLVTQEGPERTWNWRPITKIELGTAIKPE